MRDVNRAGEIIAHSLADKDVGDITEVACLLASVEGSIASVIVADGAYNGTSVYDAAAARQHAPPPQIVIPPRALSQISGVAKFSFRGWIGLSSEGVELLCRT